MRLRKEIKMLRDNIDWIEDDISDLKRDLWGLQTPPLFSIGDAVSVVVEGQLRGGTVSDVINRRGWLYKIVDSKGIVISSGYMNELKNGHYHKQSTIAKCKKTTTQST